MSRLAASLRRGDRWIPMLFFAFFGVVLIANGSLIVAAFTSWPGLETTSAYQRGLAYNRMLAAATEQAKLDWQVGFGFSQHGPRHGVVQVDLADRFGNFLREAEVRAQFVRPTSEGNDFWVDLVHQTGGRYLTEVDLPLDGQWDIHLDATSRGQTYSLRERVFLRP
jgi:nitrogen fixation protein FixH